MRLRTIPITVLASVALLAGCGDGGDDRPGAAEWRARWEAARDVVPSAQTIAADGEDACGDALGDLRAAREELLETPRPVLDDTVADWLAEAEGLLLDCPDEADVVRERVQDLRVLGAEIDAGLEALAGN